jgi:hypothetical protein
VKVHSKFSLGYSSSITFRSSTVRHFHYTMAKGLRASVNKSNKSRLRSRVFDPVETARTERLSAKLLELASQPKPERAEMDLDADTTGKFRFLPNQRKFSLKYSIKRRSVKEQSRRAADRRCVGSRCA